MGRIVSAFLDLAKEYAFLTAKVKNVCSKILHGFIIGVAGPFHYHIRRNAQRQSIDDKGSSASREAPSGTGKV